MPRQQIAGRTAVFARTQTVEEMICGVAESLTPSWEYSTELRSLVVVLAGRSAAGSAESRLAAALQEDQPGRPRIRGLGDLHVVLAI